MTRKRSNQKLLDAVKNNDIAGVKEALTHCTNVNAQNGCGENALVLAAWYGYTDIVRLLIEHEANINAVDKYGNTALMTAAFHGRTVMMKVLMRFGADINIKNFAGLTALDILKVNHPEKYDKWIQNTVLKQRKKKLRKEDSLAGQDIVPDFEI